MFYRLNALGVRVIAKFKNFSPDQNFYIFSDPRGGSTWLTELIQQIPETAVLWEPLHLKYAKDFQDLGFNWRQHIPEEAEWDSARQEFERLLKGKNWNIFSSQMTTPVTLHQAKQLIVKFCRGNRLLPWLVKQFDFKYKPIYMVRHPFSVVASQLKQGGWDNVAPVFRIPDSPYAELETKNKDYLESLQSKEEILTAYWCLSNHDLLKYRDKSRWISISYENLFLNTKSVIAHIFDEWKLKIPPNFQYGKPSKTSSGSLHTNSLLQLSKWKTQFTANQINAMRKVLNHFEITEYADDILPQDDN